MTTQKEQERKDFADWQGYKKGGGNLSYTQWIKKGRPLLGALMPYAQGLTATPEYAAKMAEVMGGGKTQLQTTKEEEEEVDTEKLPPNMFKTYEEALVAAPEGWEPELTDLGYWSFRRAPTQKVTDMPEGFYKTYKDATIAAPEGYVPIQTSEGWWTVQRDPDYFDRKSKETPYGVNPYDNPETPAQEGQWNPYQGQWEAPAGWISPYEQGQLSLKEKQLEQQGLQDEAMLGWYREQAQMQQQEQERQYTSQLMANPMSWLQYSAYTGQTPVVQEWMKPLMSGQYQTGQPMPGWTGGQGGGQSLPELRTPSAQLWGRMGPTAQQGYMGYQQATTGSNPEETSFRLWSQAPPSGRFGGLRRMR